MLYIITISSNYIRDAQYADTFGLSDTETQEDIFMESDRSQPQPAPSGVRCRGAAGAGQQYSRTGHHHPHHVAAG